MAANGDATGENAVVIDMAAFRQRQAVTGVNKYVRFTDVAEKKQTVIQRPRVNTEQEPSADTAARIETVKEVFQRLLERAMTGNEPELPPIA